MPDVTVTWTITDNQKERLDRWFADYNAKISTPFADIEAFIHSNVLDMFKDALNAQDAVDFDDVWDSLTADQKSRIKAIVNE